MRCSFLRQMFAFRLLKMIFLSLYHYDITIFGTVLRPGFAVHTVTLDLSVNCVFIEIMQL